MDANRFVTRSLRDARVLRILAAALDAVEPGAAVRRYLEEHPISHTGRLFGLSIGKAALPMLDALNGLVPLDGGLAIAKHASFRPPGLLTVMESGHPVPDARSLAAGEAALEFVSRLGADDLLICLISGGGSALMTAPFIPLEDMQALTSALLACGARIDEINTLRRHLDRVKGGGLARAAHGASILSLILSDVVGDSLEAIASGPTASDPTTRRGALDILRKYKLGGDIPASVFETMQETLKPGDPIFSRVQNAVIASNQIALQAALRQAELEGFHIISPITDLQGEAREVGRDLASRLRVATLGKRRPFCMAAGGETTVTLHGLHSRGRGGRNQELALAAIPELTGLEDVMLVSLATDGEDGPTDAAGAVATGESLQRAETLGLDAAGHLSRNDAYPFFDGLGDLIRSGPSGTNVNDLVLMFAF